MPLIAIVEDEALVALDIAKTMKRAGYEIAGPFARGSDYGKALDEGGIFDLALVDISLLDSASGDESAVISRDAASVPTVFMSALSDPDIPADANGAKPLGILVKPFSERELLGTTEIALFRAGMERRLSLSEKRYRELFDRSLSPRCIADREGRIVEENESFARIFSTSGQPLSLSSLFNPEGWDRVKRDLNLGRTILGEEFQMKDCGGRPLSILASLSRLSDESGSPLISAEFFDLTESHRLREELQQSQKMDAMGRLAGGIAHDFNNILTAIVGHAEMLKMDFGPEDSPYEDIEGIAKAAGRASRLTKQLLGFSRKQAYSPKPVRLASIVRETEGILRKLSGESLLFSVKLPTGDPVVLADPIQIEQVLINLVVNARDALEDKPGGRINVIVGEKIISEEKRIGSATLPPGRYATMEVADNGRGIPESLISKVFDPFFTTKEMGKGTGLGLAIVTSIAARGGGAVGLHSEAGVGSEFTLWLPSLDGEKSAAVDVARESEEDQENKDLVLSGNPAVLLVDDDESLLGFLSYVIDKAGARALPARNGGEAFLLVEKEKCDAMVIDLNLPGMSGFELYTKLSFRTPAKCVFISGRIEPGLDIPAEARLLEKPFTPWQLISSLKSSLAS